MDNEVVFRPAGPDPLHDRQILLIATGFYVFVQLVFLDGSEERIGFTLFFLVFLGLGLWLSRRSQRTWPTTIRISDRGITSDDLLTRSGISFVPWHEIERLDLFRNQHNMAPFLRIGLLPGPLRTRVRSRQTRLARWSMGLDVNLPVDVDAAPEVVLETARQRWAAHRTRRNPPPHDADN